MISRRNIRVKVMQTLYTLASMDEGEQNIRAAARMLNDKLNQALDIFSVALLYTVRVAQYAETDAQQRSFKYLPTAEDKNVSIRIATNSFVSKVLASASLKEKIKNDKLEKYIDGEWVKKIYQQLIKTDEYSAYIALAEPTTQEDREIVRCIWEKQILANEDLQNFFNDELPGWEDDVELIAMLMQNFFSGTSRLNFQKLLSDEKKDYAKELLETVIEKQEYCMSLIEPRLNNWDKERVALIDLLLLRMGVCEFLFFPTIPTKVTINEYIDIAKQYSTPQSGQFVNGVLDNILKDLEKDSKISKIDRKAGN